MSITIDHISKKYGAQLALNAATFEIEKGEVVALLGPNGAGKSTLMKILTGVIDADSGEIKVDGCLLDAVSIVHKKRIGYLPENNPLNYDMYVREFLDFIGGMYKIMKKKERIKEVIELTGLERECHKKIGALSKGYKQRVGLAQAILHDPDILILDEPTSGLDPNQLIGIRELIRSLSKDKTVILSTHILQEVEAICDRIVILNKGKIVASGLPGELTSNNTQQIFIQYKYLPELQVFESLTDIEFHTDGEGILFTSLKGDIRTLLFQHAVDHQLIILEMVEKSRNLEDVFKNVTQI